MKEAFCKKMRSAYFKLYIKIAEKKYKRLRYLLQTKKESDTLIVCFSGFGTGGSARYNYVRSLESVIANKLFILDNFGYNKQGSYYLGENGDWFLPEMVVSLIQKIKEEKNIKRLVLIGSSKGGTAALFYGIKTGADACIIGAPQYFIGDYLSIDKHVPILKGIMGDASSDSIQKLNMLLSDCVSSSDLNKPKVYIHYSPKEHTYIEHIADMIGDLRRCGYTVYEDSDYSYVDHSQVAKHFPRFLLSALTKVMEEPLK